MKGKFHDNVKRSVTKAITFRALILCADGLIIYKLTHRVDVAIGVMIFSNLSSTLIYFIHERAWDGVHWGKGGK